MRRIVVFFAIALIATLTACGSKSSIEQERTAIDALIKSITAQTEGDALVDPIVIRQDYAVADWTRGDVGGRTLLHRERGGWRVVLTGGEEIRDAEALTRAGLEQRQAKALANTLIAKERMVPEQRLSALDGYQRTAAAQ